MNSLHKTQSAFATDLWKDGLDQTRGMFIDDGLAASRRFSVYRNNMRATLSDALAAIYPVVERLVGRDFFGFLTDRYFRVHPSRSGNLHNLGYAFARFLSHFQAVSKLPYLPDVARLEWACHEVFHAAAPRSSELKTLEQVVIEDYPKLRLNFGKACRLVRSTYPVFRIWKVNQETYNGDKTVNLDEGADSVLIVRPELEIELWRLDPADSTFLSALESGRNLGEAVETTLAHSREFNLHASLARYLSSGALTFSWDQARQLGRRLHNTQVVDAPAERIGAGVVSTERCRDPNRTLG